MQTHSLENELIGALVDGRFEDYLERAEGESRIYLMGEECGWNRQTVLDWLTSPETNPTNYWMGEERFAWCFDSGAMKVQSLAYHRVLLAYRAGKEK